MTTKPVIIVQPSTGFLSVDLRALWHYRELLLFLVWRDIKVRYKQTILGGAWAVFQPLMTMLIFTLVFGKFANIPSNGQPYSIFVYVALLPWTFFSEAVSRSSTSLVSDANLLRKVYFPRLIIPLAAVLTPAVDFVLSFVVLMAMMAWFGIAPTAAIVTLPLFLFLSFVTSLAVGLWLSALNVRYRDVRHIIPFVAQFWLYASPVAYPLTLVPEQWRWLYSLNPMVGVIEGFRWALLGQAIPDVKVIALSASMVTVFLVGGLIFFKRMEHTFADVV